MAATLEWGREENPYHLLGNSPPSGSCANAQYVGIVVETRHFGGEGIVA